MQISIKTIELIWLLIGLGFIAADAFIGFLFFPIYISSFIVLLISVFIDNVAVEALIFAILTLILYIIFKPKLKKFMKNMPKVENRSFATIGEEFFVEEVFDNNPYQGKIKKNGIFYIVYSNDLLKVGDRVRIIKIDGLKLIVEKIKG